jgi:hypothetical protein
LRPEDLPRHELFELYKVAIDEYRYEVRLNWDRMQYFVVLNTAILSAGLGLLKLPGDRSINPSIVFVFAFGFIASLLGKSVATSSHRYYRMARLKKTLIESLLGLHHSTRGYSHPNANLAVTTTAGMTEAMQELSDEGWRRVGHRLQRRSVIWSVVWLFHLFAFVNAAMAAYTLYYHFMVTPSYLRSFV